MVKTCSQKFELRVRITTLLNGFARAWVRARTLARLS